jgi:uncharacterized SAM-binding protein YcdF (DUF218 family)
VSNVVVVRRVLVWILSSIGLVFLLAIFTPVTAWYGRALAHGSGWRHNIPPPVIPPGANLIVLAAGDGHLDNLDEHSLRRCYSALRLYRATQIQRVIVSGKGVAEPMRDFFVEHGVPAEKILVEPNATNTRENASFVHELLLRNPAPQTFLVTSDFHMLRAARVFQRAGIQARLFVSADALAQAWSTEERPSALLAELTESIKILYYGVRGWL